MSGASTEAPKRRKQRTCLELDVYASEWDVQVYYRSGRSGRDTTEPMYSLGNFGIGEDVVNMLETLGHAVNRYWTGEPDECPEGYSCE